MFDYRSTIDWVSVVAVFGGSLQPVDNSAIRVSPYNVVGFWIWIDNILDIVYPIYSLTNIDNNRNEYVTREWIYNWGLSIEFSRVRGRYRIVEINYRG